MGNTSRATNSADLQSAFCALLCFILILYLFLFFIVGFLCKSLEIPHEMPCAKFQKEKPTLLKLSFPSERQICLCRQNKMKWKTAGNVSRKRV